VLLNARRHAAKLGRRVDSIGRIDPAEGPGGAGDIEAAMKHHDLG
jgi:hypothetical protein